MCCPLTSNTKGLIGKEQLALMKKSTFLINTARKDVVDTAFSASSRKKEIAKAVYDVFDSEPFFPKNYPLLQSCNTTHFTYRFLSVESIKNSAFSKIFNTLIHLFQSIQMKFDLYL